MRHQRANQINDRVFEFIWEKIQKIAQSSEPLEQENKLLASIVIYKECPLLSAKTAGKLFADRSTAAMPQQKISLGSDAI